MARYWLHVILPISIVVVSAALATAGTIEIANVRIINLHLIMVSLQLDWNCQPPKGGPPALPGRQQKFDISRSRPPMKLGPRERPRKRGEFHDGRLREQPLRLHVHAKTRLLAQSHRGLLLQVCPLRPASHPS